MTAMTVRWEDFESAFIIGSLDARYFLNLDTGETEYTSHMDGDTVKARVLQKVESGHFLEIPCPSFDDAMAEVSAFISSENAETQTRLKEGMMEHRSPFLGFNRAIGSDRELRARWSAHRQAGIERRLISFCRDHELAIENEVYKQLLKKHLTN